MTRSPPWPRSRRALKRAVDLALATLGLVVLALPIAALAVAVRMTSRGPAFFRQERMGRNGRLFRVWKLRTMGDGADRAGPPVTVSGDRRVTRLGRWLRRHKLDELPQLWNVWRGDMSFVGPRPEVPRYRSCYRPEDEIVLAVRPGITDLASITYRDEECVLAAMADPEHGYVDELLPRKLALARQYVVEQSTFGDFRLILRTLAVIAWRGGGKASRAPGNRVSSAGVADLR